MELLPFRRKLEPRISAKNLKDKDLFDSDTTSKDGNKTGPHEPLASRMRPRNLKEFIGQEHIIGQGRLLRRAIQADQLTSVIFYGPPGTGKTTLARVIANHTKSSFVSLNAVLAGVQQIRDATTQAEQARKLYDRRTILFVDEVHRWNKAQQDALLPWVENGTIILIGATTENPFFEVNKALVSRSRIFQLSPLTTEDLKNIVQTALTDKERGYGNWNVSIDDNALDHLINTTSGDARTILNALELAVESSVQNWPLPFNSSIHIDLETAEESIQQKLVLYDRDGDYHYDVISAFIKSIRGSDPDASLYWLARMVAAGENPNFIFRRMLISACEDIGMANPYALSVVESAAQAFDRVGLPEGRYHLAHAALYLATSPKSNSSLGFFDALASIEKEDTEVPNHLKDANRDAKGFGHGQDYQYPHAYREHWVAQQYLPDQLIGRIFYTPSNQGYEASIRDKVLQKRELSLCELTEKKPKNEFLSFSPPQRGRDEWTRRLDSHKTETLLTIRNSLLRQANIERHSRTLVIDADDGLFLWELGRLSPEGLVVGLCETAQAKQNLERLAENLEILDRPLLFTDKNDSALLDLRFDRIIARDQGLTLTELCAFFTSYKVFMDKKAQMLCINRLPSKGMRLSRLLKADNPLRQSIEVAENDFYTNSTEEIFRWDENSLAEALTAQGLQAETQLISISELKKISQIDIERWTNGENSAYGKAVLSAVGPLRLAQFATNLCEVAQSSPIRWEYSLVLCTVNLS